MNFKLGFLAIIVACMGLYGAQNTTSEVSEDTEKIGLLQRYKQKINRFLDGIYASVSTSMKAASANIKAKFTSADMQVQEDMQKKDADNHKARIRRVLRK